MIASLICKLLGHDSYWDQIRGVKLFRCRRCSLVKVRDVSDPRPVIVNTHPRFTLVKGRKIA